jgi:hypothetical protein
VGAFGVALRRDAERARRSDIYASAAKFPMSGFATAGRTVTSDKHASKDMPQLTMPTT